MFEKTPRNSGRYPWKIEADSVGQDLDKLLDEMVRQGHADEAHNILEPIVGSMLDLLDNNTMSSEIKALAASFLRTYGEDWTVRYDEKTLNQIKEFLGE